MNVRLRSMAAPNQTKKLAVAAALQYVETRPLNPEEFIKLVESLFKFYSNETK